MLHLSLLLSSLIKSVCSKSNSTVEKELSTEGTVQEMTHYAAPPVYLFPTPAAETTLSSDAPCFPCIFL